MGAWQWRRKDRPDEPADSGKAPETAASPGIRLGVNVLPTPGRAPRRAPEPGAPPNGPAPSAGPAATADTGADDSEADQHVRRMVALAELSLLALDHD
jgi:hypothetical protein